jgi:hypothetical protein
MAQASRRDRSPDEQACVLFLGQTGLGKKVLAKALLAEISQRAAGAGVKPGEIWEHFDLEQDFLDPGRPIRDFLQDLPFERQGAWDTAANELISRVKASDARHVGVFLHGYYWFRGEFFTHIDVNALRGLQPTLIVTLIDDAYDVHTRIMQREAEFETGADELVLPQLLTWRWAEISIGDLLARSVRGDRRVRHLVFAVKHSANTLRQLILERQRLPVYASFPITRVRRPRTGITKSNRESLQSEVNAFRKRLRGEGFTVLDPLTIDEYRLTDGGELLERWDIADLDPMVPPETDLHQETLRQVGDEHTRRPLMSEVKVQITRRDFRMIDGAAVVATYRPAAFDGIPSAGTTAEIRYGERTKRGTVMVHVADTDGGAFGAGDSPFGEDVKPIVVPDLDRLIEHLRQRQEDRSALFAAEKEPQAWTDLAGNVLQYRYAMG